MNAKPKTILEGKDLTKDFPIVGGKLPVLKGVNLEIREGEILAIAGKSGVGKSTLLHILGVLDIPTNGSVIYHDRDLALLSTAERAEVRNRHFGFIFQFYHLLPEFTALENVLIPAMIGHGVLGWLGVRRTLRKRACDLLEKVGLSERLTHRPSQLSGGEQQRVAIARAMMNEPRILFCDEPTGNLDSQTSAEIVEMIWSLNRDTGQTCVIVTHDEMMAKEASRIVSMVDGKIV
jgi:lipoprotein-releasing system ATP-binding protein